ncbi:Mutator-like transposase [Hordeum vulgare]|nr:Mutator-like transposase [Hordeum vulgare]
MKCDHINTNLAESFNNKVKQLKDLPLHDMVDQIRIMLMRLWELRRRIGDCLQGDKLPAVVQQVVNRGLNLSHFSVEKSLLWGAEVRDNKTGRRHVVNTELHDCTCVEWQHTDEFQTEETHVEVHTEETETAANEFQTEEAHVKVHIQAEETQTETAPYEF